MSASAVVVTVINARQFAAKTMVGVYSYCLLVFCLFPCVPSCFSTPGLLNFSQTNAFIELDTQAFSCSNDSQMLFSFSFDVFVNTNSSVIFTGISGTHLPMKSTRETHTSTVADHQGDPLVLFIYFERPYFRLMVMRLTDRQVRFYLHHALGFFDRRWHGWHRLEVRLNRHGGAHSNPYSTTPVVPRVEIRFSVDQKTNRGYMKAGDVLWLDWAEFKSRGYLQKDAARQFYSNEAFLGLPPAGTMSEYAVGTLIKYRDVIQRHLSADNDTTLAAKSAVAFRPFQGGIKSFLIASECACGLSKQFGPRMVQIGAGVAIQSVCDVRSLPPLNANYSGVCKSKVNESTCGCVGFGNRHVCYCPGSCNALKVHGSTSTRVALLDNAVPAPNLLEESKLLVSNDRDQSNAYLSENPSTYKQMDSCFSNIFLCEEPVTYQFWMFIDPAAVLTGATRILKHASHPNSPWYLEVVYQGIPKLEAPTVERIMQLTVELRAPPHFNWMIDRCESDLRATPDQWHQIRIHWNKRNLSLFIDDTICGVAGTNISTIKATSDQRFATRRTAYVFLGAHTIQDFTFNGQRLQRTFYRSTYFTNAIGEIEPVSRNLSDDFYVAFQLNTSKSVASVRLPGINVTSVNAKGILVVSSEHGDCIVFHQPVNCLSSAPCHVEVERTHDIINVYSQNSLLRVSSVNSEECSIARRSPTESGLAPNTEVRLFSRDRRELLKRRLIMTTPFPVLECNFDDVPRTFKDAIQDPSTICAPSQAFPNIQVQSLDGPLESAVQDTLMVSSSRLAVTTSDTAPESVCLRDIQLCQFGLTTSFWVLHLPASASPRSWPIYRLEGPSGSRMRVYLTKTATEYRLETTVMSLESIIAGKAVSRVWKVAVAVNSIDQNWVHVTTSWSHSAGLSVKVNGTIVATSREPFEESADWELPSLTGLLLGYNRQPDQEEGVVIDDFQFIPAELNHLASVGQTIDRKLSNQGLEICRHHTCLEGSTCFPMQHATTSRGNFCRCEDPWRVCKESQILASTTTTAAPPSRSLQVTVSSPPPPLTTAATTRPSIKPPVRVEEQPRVMDAGPGEPVEISPSSGLAPLSPRQRIRTFASPACDPPCENGGGCVQASSGDFVCDCSETLYWGLTCTREHVGWMSQNEDKSSTRPAQEAFASFSQLVNGRVRLRFIFRHPVIGRKVASQGRIQRSVPEEPPGRDMALVTFVGSSGTPVFGLVLTGGELFYVWKNDSTFRTRLDPCNRQTTQLAPNDGAPHLVHLELLGAFLRVKVDGIAFYPRASTPPTCDAWRYFAGGLDGNGSTAVEPDAADEKEATAAFQVITLGAWSNGDDAFDGAIGGWLVTDAEMIRPKFVEAYDTPNTIYRLNNRFDLSGGRFYWVRLNSLTPVIVLHDSATTTLGDLPVAVWFWIVGCVVLGLLMTLLVVWMCLRVRRRRKPDIKGTWRRGYVSIKRMTKSPAPLSSSTTRRLTTDDAARPLKTNGHLLPSSVYRMKANTTANSASPTEPVDNLWRARMLTLQPLNRPVSVIGPTPINAGSTNSLSEYDDTDDIEEILVTPDGESVITLSTNHGISVKQWNTHDGICHKEIFSRQKTRSTASETRGFLALHKEAGLLFADDQNLAQLHPFSPKLPSAAVQLPSTIWGVFPFGDLFLIVAAPLADDRDSFASLHFWSPVLKLFVVQSRLRIKTSWRTKGYLPSNAKRLPPLLSPSQEKVLLRWSCPAVNTYSFCITVDMSAVSKEVASKPNPVIATDPHISATLTKHPIDLRRTTFLTEDYGVTGDSRGFLHIWDVQSGTVYCTVQSDPVPMDGPILNDFSHLPVDPRAIPITALATNESTAVENGRFTWLCSGDESGCVVVRRCVATENGASKNIAARVHAKFRPYSRVTGAYSADTVTCIRLLNRPRRQTNKPEAFLATGDSSGCVRVWLLPQCTQLAQLSASCESSLRDLVLTQPASSATLSSQWVQVVGLVRRDRSAGSSYEHGRVIIVHLSASEDNGVRNAMHSPRIRIIQNQMTTRPI